MPQAPNLGLVGAYGASGVQKAIQEMVAERRAQEKLEYERAIAEREWRAQQEEVKALQAHRAALQQYQLEDLNVRKAAASQRPKPIVHSGLAGTDPTDKRKYTVGIDPDTGERRWQQLEAETEPKAPNLTPLEAYLAQRNQEQIDAGGKPFSSADFKAATREYNLGTTREPRDPVMLIQTMDPQGRPIIQGVPQSQARGQTFTSPPSAAQQTQMAELESGADLISDLEKQFDPSYVGPVEGRLGPTGQKVGIAGSPGQAKFYGAAAALKNEIIRLITGAAVGVQEAARLEQEIPDIRDPDDVFLAKLQQTKQNRATLLNAIRNRAGIGGAGGGKFQATDPEGTVHTFSSQAAMERAQKGWAAYVARTKPKKGGR